jgi:hypothetical protein
MEDQSLRQCGTAQKTAGSVRFGLLIGYNLLKQFQFGTNPDLELNRQFGTVAHTTQDT